MKLSSSVDETHIGNNRSDGFVRRVFRALVHEDGEEGLVVAKRQQYWGLLELLAQLGLFTTVPESYSDRLYSLKLVEGESRQAPICFLELSGVQL